MDGKTQRHAANGVLPWLTLPQQRLVAVLTVAAQLGICGWWLREGGMTGGLIRHDQMTQLPCRSQLDVNECDWPELTLLPGIGETMARRIVSDRTNRGPFTQIEDLQRIRGIGPKKLAQLKPYLVCSPPALRPGPSTNSGRADEPTKKP